VPELIVALWRTGRNGGGAVFARLRERLDALIALLEVFPTPWGLKLFAEQRGLGHASFGLPLSAEREKQVEAFGRSGGGRLICMWASARRFRCARGKAPLPGP